MREIFKYEKRPDYPHMNIRDKEIWERYLEAWPMYYDSCQYDLHIGDAPPFNTLMDDDEDRNQDMLYRLRIDVVGHNGVDRDIIEVKPNAGPSTIGQVQSYANLYTRDEEPRGVVKAVIITDKERPNMAYLCKEAKVDLIIV